MCIHSHAIDNLTPLRSTALATMLAPCGLPRISCTPYPCRPALAALWPPCSLPEELGTLTSITHLDLCSNALQSLFGSLANLQQLKLLNCDSNRLQALPETVPLLRSLVVLSVSGNGLRYLPDQLGYRQPMLASINCSGNAIEALPPGARREGGGVVGL